MNGPGIFSSLVVLGGTHSPPASVARAHASLYTVSLFLLRHLAVFRKFYTEVWLNSGMRGVFLALGFRQRGEGAIVLDPLAANTLECTAIILKARS